MLLIPNYKDNLNSIINGKSVLNKAFELIDGNYVHKNAIIDWDNIIIGKGNIFGPMSVIGGAAQHKYYTTSGKLKIGNDNIFSEFSVISRPTSLTNETIIGDRNHFMSNSIIHHDCVIENDTVVCSNASVAGNVRIMRGVYLGQNSSVHQFQIVGSYSILGMNSCVTKKSNIIPGRKYVGVPSRDIGENTIALERGNIKSEHLNKEIKRFQILQKQMHSNFQT
jgi:UDP-N-acetylglucosamine acyltransferase